MAKINFDKLGTEQSFEAIFQIVVLVVGIVAFGFIIGDLETLPTTEVHKALCSQCKKQ